MRELPTGTVTFLFTDIEGSTRLLHELGNRYAEVLTEHGRLVREACDQYGGRVVDTQGDSFFVAFGDARDAVTAAAEVQKALAEHGWPDGVAVLVRMGIHTGEPLVVDTHYVGIDVHRAARIGAAAHGGQVLVSDRTRELVANGAATPTLRDLGGHRLKDLPEPERLFQLLVEGLPSSFPPLRVQEDAVKSAGLPDYSAPPADVPCPYKGLEPFQPEDSELFFGREELVDDLVARLEEAPFLAVVGPSGSGKSSLVRAGVLPALERRDASLAASIFAPGAHPLAELENAADAGRLLVVDQFEEVFTLCRDEDERRAFIDELLDAAERGTRVIVALRADFYGHCAAYPRLASALEQRQALVGPMSEEELRRAIERPAEQAGLLLEPGLVEAILRDVLGEPGALPLLSHSLLETWKRRSGRLLTLIGYLQAGGVRGAIAKTAETVYRAALSERQQALARNIFLRLTELGEGTEDTRRRVRMEELVPREQEAAEVEEVLRVLVEARLVTVGEGTVEVAHEAVIRHWPTLRAWLDEDREGTLAHRRLTEAAREWEALGRDPGALYRGTRLAGASEWAALHDAELNELEREFLAASRQASEHEAERQRRTNRRLRALLVGTAAFLVVALVAGGFALVQRGQARGEADRAERETRIATSRALAAQATPAFRNRLDLGLLLSLEAHRVAPTVEARSSVLGGLEASANVVEFLRGHKDRVGSVAFGPDGRTFASASDDATITLWDVERRRPLGKLAGHRAPVLGVAFSPDGKTLASAGADGTVILWDVARSRPRRKLAGHRAPVIGVAFSPDGKTLASASEDRTVILWDVERGRSVGKQLAGHRAPVFSVAFSPDGKTLASAGDDGTIILWDVERGRSLGKPLAEHTAAVYGVAFSPDGRTLASASEDRTVILWDVGDRRPLGKPLAGHARTLFGVAFSPDGKTLASASADGTIILWDVGARRLLGTLAEHTAAVYGVAFSPDGKTLASASADRTIILWDAGARRPLGRLAAAAVIGVAFSPDGKTLASAGDDGTIILWDVERRRPLGKLAGHRAPVLGATFSPDGRTLASAGADGIVILWDVARSRPRKKLAGHRAPVIGVAFSPDGKTLASASDDGTIILWDVERGRSVGKQLAGRRAPAFSAAFSPDGKTLASAGDDGTIILWDVEARRPLGTLAEHSAAVYGVAFSPDGKTLASASADRTIILWDVERRRPLGRLAEHTAAVISVAFSPDGKALASASADRTVILWNRLFWSTDIGPLRKRLCRIVARNLTRAEWDRFLPGQGYRKTCAQWPLVP